MWKIAAGFAGVISVLLVIFWGDVIASLTGGSWQLDPSVSPSLFALGLVMGVAMVIWVFYVIQYDSSLKNSARHPISSARSALFITVLLSMVWIFVDIALYYSWLNPKPDLEDLPLLDSLYGYWGPILCGLFNLGFGLVFSLARLPLARRA